MKVCLISEYFHPDDTGGTGTVVSNLSRYLKDHYKDVELEAITSTNLYRGEAKKLPTYEVWDGIPIFRLKTPKSNRPSSALRLLAGLAFTAAVFLKLMRRPRYDVLLIVTNPPTLPMATKAFRKLRGTPYVYLVHDLYPDVAVALEVLSRESRVARIFHSLQRGWLNHAARVVVLGRCMRDYLVQNYQLPAESVAVITNWSNGEKIRPLSKDTGFRKKNGLDGIVVLYAGNFGQYQNFDCILDAAKELRDDSPSIRFVFVGQGARKQHIEGRVEAEQLRNVKMYPFVPHAEFDDLLASADISLVTLEPGAEGLGVPSKFYNILASGRPTVALVAPGSEVARVLEEGECGVRVEQGDHAGLANVLRQLASDTGELQRMGDNARQTFESDYTLPAVAGRFHDLLTQVAQQNN